MPRTTLPSIALAAVLLPASAGALADTPVGGLIIEDTVWAAADSPYVVTSQLVVGGDATLTIEPGVTVRVGQGLSMLIGSTAFGGATLVARGTADLPIAITSDSAAPASGDWAQMVLGKYLVDAELDPDTGEYLAGSIIEHCSIGYGGGAGAETGFRVFNCAPYIGALTVHDMATQGMLLYPRAGHDMRLRDCAIFRSGSQTAKGGALGLGGESITITLERCRFEDNVGDWGGAVYTYPEGTRFIECTFRNNRAGPFAGAVYCTRRFHTFERCVFEGNSATREGGAIWSTDGALGFTDCSFVGNFVDAVLSEGGAIFIDGGVNVIQGCAFEGNFVSGSSSNAVGGALKVVGTNGRGMISQCRFEGNWAYSYEDDAFAGAVYSGSNDLVGNTFIGNRAIGETASARVRGGAAVFYGPGLEFNTFESNAAEGVGASGGAVWQEALGAHYVGNTFIGNTAGAKGGAVYAHSRFSLAWDPATRAVNTFLDNDAPLGSALYNGVAYNANGQNDIDASHVCWGTSDLDEIGAMIHDFFDDGTLSVVGFYPPGPCPGGCVADWNVDGAVDTRDFIAYLNDWAAKTPGADLDGDGVVDTRDFVAYLNLWAAGC